MRVELRDEARDDLVDGAVFYADQSPGLDDHFLECLRADLKKLETTAGIHERYRGFHRSLSDRFPFAIYYQVVEDLADYSYSGVSRYSYSKRGADDRTHLRPRSTR